MDFIDCNLKHGVAPRRIHKYLQDTFNEFVSEKKVYERKRMVCPSVETKPMIEIIYPCEDDDIDVNDTVEVYNLAVKLNLKAGNELLKDLNKNDKLRGNNVQLYASTLRTILSMSKENEVTTSESLSDLVEDETIMMLNDWSKTE